MQPAATFSVGLFAGLIALLQWNLARLKQRYELFPIRFRLYLVVMRFIANYAILGEFTEEELHRFGRRTYRAQFFLAPKLSPLLKEYLGMQRSSGK